MAKELKNLLMNFKTNIPSHTDLFDGKKNKLRKFIFIHELTTGNTATLSIIYAAFFLNEKDGYICLLQ